MITFASVDYCERCKCRTLHIPLPSGERACEHHPPGHELAPASPPARFDERLEADGFYAARVHPARER